MISEIVEVKPFMRAERRSSGPAFLGRAFFMAGVIWIEWTSSSRLPATIAKNAANTKPRKATVSMAAVARVTFLEGMLFIIIPRYSVTSLTSMSVILSRSSTATHSKRPWKFMPPVAMLGQGRPL